MRAVARSLVFILLLPLVTAAPRSAPGRGAADIVTVLPAEAAGCRAAGADRVFTRGTAAGYLGGTAGLYLSYGFRRLVVRDYKSAAGASVVAEAFDMTTPADAFGVFAEDPKGDEAAVGNESRYGGGRLRFWKGACFVVLWAAREAAGTKALLTGLGRAIAAAIPEAGGRPALVGALPPEGLEPRSVRYFHKQASLDSEYYLADESVLSLDQRTEAALGRYREARGESLLLICRYRSAADARRAYLAFGRAFFRGRVDERANGVIERLENGQFAAARSVGPCLVVVLESPDRPGCEAFAEAAAARCRDAFGKTGGPK